MKRALIISGGDFSSPEFYRPIVNSASYIICADRGYDYCLQLGVKPHVVIGDMDSAQAAPSGVTLLRHSSMKDETDTHLAVLHSLEQNYNNISIICALGGRYDHALSNIMLLKKIHNMGGQGEIIDPQNHITYLKGETQMEGKGYLSLIPITESVITLKNLKYRLDKHKTNPEDGLCVSNQFIGKKATIQVDGEVFVIRSFDKIST